MDQQASGIQEGQVRKGPNRQIYKIQGASGEYMRKLTKEEEILTKKGIEKLKKEIIELEETKIVFSAREKFIKAKHEYEKLAIPFNSKIEIEEVNKTLNTISEQLETKIYSINEMNKHLKVGVQEKENKLTQ